MKLPDSNMIFKITFLNAVGEAYITYVCVYICVHTHKHRTTWEWVGLLAQQV